ncbi:MAG: hypothetical protein KDN19_09660, partial [Verrucomicrobiae bacterium]|nr:hypothetical protein [Verrucomicrobiae bacterium]
MSDYPLTEKPRFPILALVIGLLWAGLIGAFWYLRPTDGKEVSHWWLFFGRFHPLIVHAPIGLIVIVPILELIGRKPGRESIRDAVPVVLWLTVLSSAVSTVMGYLLMLGEPDDSVLMERHLWTGLGFGALIFITLMVRGRKPGFFYSICLLGSLVLVSLAGHFGGALVHGTTYLSKYAPEALKPFMDIGLGDHHSETPEGGEKAPEPAKDVPLEERIVFTDFVMPIMEAKCNECHNADKTKGKLRLDTYEVMMAGAEGADYPNVEPGDSEASELVYRVVLPSDDDDFMPPDGKEAMTPEEIAVVRWWIDQGAKADAKVADLKPDDAMTANLVTVFGVHEASAEKSAAGAAGAEASAGADGGWESLSPEEQQERTNEVLAAAEHFHFSVMPISAEDDRLKVNVVNASGEFGNEQLATLEPVAERVVWLDIGNSQVDDAGLDSVARMPNLERLHLENTKVTDAGIAKLAGLANLQYLNLYGTEVTAAIFQPLANARNLKKLFLWQTKVDPAEARSFQRSMSLEVNIGTELATAAQPETPAEEKAAPAEAPQAPAPVAEKKPEPEKKPADKKPAEAKTPAAKPVTKKEEPKKPEPAPASKTPPKQPTPPKADVP